MSLSSTSASKDNPQNKLILLDRDGVINQDVGSPGVTDPQQLKLTPQAGIAMGNLKRAGFQIAIVTNQSCVGKGLITRAELDIIMERLQTMLLEQDKDAQWDALYICTTNNDIEDDRRKPSPGMIEEACQEFQVSATETVFVGDTLTDMQAAQSGGVPVRILVATGYGEGLMKDYDAVVLAEVLTTGTPQLVSHKDAQTNPLQAVVPFLFAPNLQSASEWILEQHKKARDVIAF